MAQCSDDRLRLLIERIERLEEEKKAIGQDVSAVYSEAKAVGYDVKIMRQIVRLRKMKPDDRREMDMVLDTYRSALGLENAAHDQGAMFDEHDGRPDPSAPAPESSASDSERYIVALDLVVRHQKASVSWLQRQMQIGYNAASRLIERLEREGTISKPDHVGRRDVLLTEDQADAAVIAAHVTNQLKDVTMTVVPGNAQ